jgi:hypothetical protein
VVRLIPRALEEKGSYNLPGKASSKQKKECQSKIT